MKKKKIREREVLLPVVNYFYIYHYLQSPMAQRKGKKTLLNSDHSCWCFLYRSETLSCCGLSLFCQLRNSNLPCFRAYFYHPCTIVEHTPSEVSETKHTGFNEFRIWNFLSSVSRLAFFFFFFFNIIHIKNISYGKLPTAFLIKINKNPEVSFAEPEFH